MTIVRNPFEFVCFTWVGRDEEKKRKVEISWKAVARELLVRKLSKRGRRVFTAVPAARTTVAATAVYIYAALRLSGFLVSFNGEFTEVRQCRSIIREGRVEWHGVFQF